MRSRLYELLTALSMTVCRGAVARPACELAGVAGVDTVADLVRGPGAAVREAARGGEGAIGVDPSPLMLRLARWISTFRAPEPSTGSRRALRRCRSQVAAPRGAELAEPVLNGGRQTDAVT